MSKKKTPYDNYKNEIEFEKRKLLQFDRRIPENKNYLDNKKCKAAFYYIMEFVHDSEIKAAAEFLDKETIDILYKKAADIKAAHLKEFENKIELDDVLIIDYQDKANSFIKAAQDKAAAEFKKAADKKAAIDKIDQDIKKKTTELLLLKYFNLNSLIDYVNSKFYPDIKEIDWGKNDLLHVDDIIECMKLFYREIAADYNVHLDITGNKKVNGVVIIKFLKYNAAAYKLIKTPENKENNDQDKKPLSGKKLLQKIAALKDNENIAAPDVYINSILEITKKIAIEKRVEFIKAAIDKLNLYCEEFANSPEYKAAIDKAADKIIIDKAAPDKKSSKKTTKKAAQDKAADNN